MLIRTQSVCGESSILRSDQRMFISAPLLYGRKRGDMSMFRQLQNFWILWITTVVLACFSNAVAQASYKVTDLGTEGNDNVGCAMSLNDQGWTEIMAQNVEAGQVDNLFGKLLNGRLLIDVDGFKLDLGTLGGLNSSSNWGE